MSSLFKQDLPNSLIEEYRKYSELYLKFPKTTIGNPIFTSNSSGQSYSVTDNTGDNGLLKLLRDALAVYIITADDFNGKTYSDLISDHLSTIKSNAHRSNNIGNQSTVSGANVTNALDNLKVNHDNHLAALSAHDNNKIVNKSTVAGDKTSDALNTLKNADTTLNSRIDNIIAQSGTSSTEVTDSRVSDTYGNFVTLDARLEGIEKRSKYFLRQVTTVQAGANTITLNQTPENHHELLIYDNKYSCIWLKDVHWTRSGNIITFTEINGLPETLSFTIYNLG